MGIFDKVKEPIFLKEGSNAKEQLEELVEMSDKIPSKYKMEFDRDVRLLRAGIIGEDKIDFELRNSHMPLWIIHDLFIEYEDFKAQIDYLIVTRKRTFVVECKNLVGNIEINSSGDFIRTFDGGRKEGLYSPITQNERHLEVIKKIRYQEKNNFITKFLFEKYFNVNYRSVIVLANPKTYLNYKYAKKDVREKVIRADQLINFIKRVNSEKDSEAQSEEYADDLARYFLSIGKESDKDLVNKYTKIIEETGTEQKTQECISDVITCPICGAIMIKRVARQGKNTGNEFYGCSNYPRCRGIRQKD